MPKRNDAIDGYRYGFQGQEKDDEIKGEGNSLNYTFRMHDPRVGRFFAVDPLFKSFQWNSPYAFSENRVLDGLELEGREFSPRDLVRAKYMPAEHKPVLLQVYDGLILTSSNTVEDLIWVGANPKEAIKGAGNLLLGLFTSNTHNPTQSTVNQKYLDLKFGTSTEASVAAFESSITTGYDKLMNGTIQDKTQITSGILLEVFGTKGVVTVKLGRLAKLLNFKPCGCFTEGTLVYTEDGYKNIEDISIGDLVWAYDNDSGNLELKRVVHTFNRDFSQIFKIYFGDEVIEATHEHPFFIGGKWLKVEELNIGDLLTLYDGSEIEIEKIELVEGNFRVYNFTVEDFHTYYVSKQNVLVHNGSPCKWVSKQASSVKEFISTEPGGQWAVEYYKEMLDKVSNLEELITTTDFYKKAIQTVDYKGKTYILDGHNRLKAVSKSKYKGEIEMENLSAEKARELFPDKMKEIESGIHTETIDP